MKDAQSLFQQVYLDTGSIETGNAELKRKGFTQNDTIMALMGVCDFSVVVADRWVMNSLAWSY